MSGDQPYGVGDDAHAEAVDRMNAASAERSRLRDAHKRAEGTSSELQVSTSLRAANDEVAARERWLQWVEDKGY
jgi:hypothetical protein